MNTETSFYAISTGLSLLGIVYLLFWRARILAEDWFRDQVFQLRDNLFDEVSDGLTGFDNPAYTTLRMTMNGYIRYCHKLSLLLILLFAIFSGKPTANHEGVFARDWKIVTKDLDPKVLKRLEHYRKHMELLVIAYLIFTSPFASILFCFLLLIGIVIKSVDDFRKTVVFGWANKIRNSSAAKLFLSDIDDTAYVSGSTL